MLLEGVEDDVSLTPLDAHCVDNKSVWLWQAEPYRLWTLLDMIRFYASSVCTATSALARAAVAAGLSDPDRDRATIQEALDDTAKTFAELPLSRLLKSQLRRTRTAA